MNMKMPCVLACIAALSACTGSQPYAEVTAERLGKADLTEETVRIVGVDGKLDPAGASSVTLAPGHHMLLLSTARRGGRRMSADAVLPLNAKPCTRYYVIARHESPTHVEPWSLEIKKIEPIAECQAKFEAGPVAQ